MSAKDAGMTLVEVCLTGIILSCLLMISWPVFSRVALETKLDAAGRNITAALMFARDRALAESRQYRVCFAPELHRVSVDVEDNPVDKPGEFTAAEDFRPRGKAWPAEIELKELSAAQVVFSPDGTADDWSLSLKDTRGQVRTVKLQGVTGRCVTE